jgi:hypothetical protein
VASPAYTAYQRLTDPYEAITVQVPSAWSDVETGRWSYQGRDVGVYVAASSDLAGFDRLEREAGAFVGVSSSLGQSTTVAEVLARERERHTGKCSRVERRDYGDRFYLGLSDSFGGCAGGHDRVSVAVLGPGGRYLVLVRASIVSAADVAAVARVFDSFQVIDRLDSDHHDD